MNKKNFNNTFLILFSISLTAIMNSACASSSPYVSKNIDNKIELLKSRYHKFTYVHVQSEDNELVLYGKIKHTHGYCEKEGHVDLAIYKSDKKLIESTSLPIVNRGIRQKGWYGAAFRMKLARKLPKDASLKLAIHDSNCTSDSTFNCGSNLATQVSQ